MKAVSHNSTKLKDRILWFDGDSTVSENYIIDAIAKGNSLDGLFVNEITPNIAQYNSLVNFDKELKVKTNIETPSLKFNLPKEYMTLDVEEYIATRLASELIHFSKQPKEKSKRIQITKYELHLYKKLKLFDVLRTLIFIVNTFQEHNIVYGVGRGSSVSSYILYLIGIHDVDSIKYELDIHEFLKT